ncbi:patatin-like phospholipase family protein [Parasphingorhabdus halotolerans]|uniref:Patatin n=1 Tax=Parasphingorhabdus halotolerans TaxID=2725558 RepID=A0A6H2DL70_9SPHN|nr:patatin-like phospholipase family protein [Parasphingorhabdus halotolerans]QJB69094.1 patatin [Parasphingorhabdus halotolerans]
MTNPLKLSLALGGGAGLGWTHIGVLRALEASPIEIAAISGTSIGAIAGASYAAGKLDYLEETARTANFRTLLRFMDPHFKRGAVMGARNIEKELDAQLGHLNFEDLAIPVAAVAADLRTGDTIIMKTGKLVPAIRASMSLPGIFKPVEHDGRLLVDGGTALPVPVSPARELAPNALCLSVNLQDDFINRVEMAGITPAGGKEPNSIAIVKASVGLSLRNLGRYSLALDPPDFAMSPRVGHIDMQNFTRADELIAIGQNETEAMIPKIMEQMEASLLKK